MAWKDRFREFTAGPRQDYRAPWPWRLAAGCLASLTVPASILLVVFPSGEHWLVLMLGAYGAFLLVYVAAFGRLPRWHHRRGGDTIERSSRD